MRISEQTLQNEYSNTRRKRRLLRETGNRISGKREGKRHFQGNYCSETGGKRRWLKNGGCPNRTQSFYPSAEENACRIQGTMTGGFGTDDIYVENWEHPVGAFHGADGGSC